MVLYLLKEGMTDRFILEAFWQKGHNCAFVAFAKVGLMCFGERGVMLVEKKEDQVKVKLRNGRKYSFTEEELKGLNKTNRTGFRRGHTETQRRNLKLIKELVRIFYAIIIRHMESKGYMGQEYSEGSAAAALNEEGMKTTYFHSMLGWKRTPSHDLEEKDLPLLKKKKHILLFSERHIVAASKGYYDRYGKATLMGGHLPYLLREKSGAWYSLR